MRIVVVTDFDETGSGYKNLCVPLLAGLVGKGHEVKVAGLSYQGKEHDYPFSVIPAGTIQDALAIATNLHYVWNPDVYIVAMDIPLQDFFYNGNGQIPGIKQMGNKYIAITPLENGPLTLSWAAILLNMDGVFFISELGKQEAVKAGISKAEHLIVGVDTVFWHPATSDEKKQLRKGLGIGDDEFVVLTVADNQERKNLWAGLESIQLLKKQTDKKIRYILVTRPDSPVGYPLNDLYIRMGLTKEVMTFKRGLPVQDLWGLYAVSDVYLSTSKAEGLGMPVLEAMACGIPCVATDTGALHELLENNRGWLIPPAYTFTDVWGGSTRNMINTKETADCLRDMVFALSSPENTSTTHKRIIEQALDDVRDRTWDIPVTQIHKAVEGMFNEQK